MKKVKVNSKSRPAEIVRLDVHAWSGQVIDRIRAKTTEPMKLLSMIDKIESISTPPLTEERKRSIRAKLIQTEKDDYEDMKRESEYIRWSRDEDGNIRSPFRSE